MDYQELADIFKTLSHPTRLKIIEMLSEEGETCVKEIWNALEIPQPTASQHINVLKNAGIITFRKEGVKTCYRLVDTRVLKIIQILKEGSDNGKGNPKYG